MPLQRGRKCPEMSASAAPGSLHNTLPAPFAVTFTVFDPATGETWWAKLEHRGSPVPVAVLVRGLLKTSLRRHGLRCRDYGITQEQRRISEGGETSCAPGEAISPAAPCPSSHC